MKKFNILLTILMVCCWNINAEAAKKKETGMTAEPNYHAGVLYECQGHVKEFKLTTQNPITRQKNVKFTKDGKQKKSILNYNEAGYPSGCDVSMGERHMIVKIDYDSDTQPVRFLIDNNVGSDLNVTITQTYTDGVMTVADWYDNESGRQLIHSEYDDHLFDDHGNWIRRTATNTMFSNSADNTDGITSKTEIYQEERSIVYY